MKLAALDMGDEKEEDAEGTWWMTMSVGQGAQSPIN